VSLAIAVVGASGVYGRHLLPRLIARGHRVRALIRRPENAASLAHCGAEVRCADVFDPDSLRVAFAGCDAVINLATSVPRPGHAPDFALNDRIRREGTRSVIDACGAAGISRLVQQSIAMIHAGGGGCWIDESSPVRPTSITQSAVDMEALVTASDRQWIILRGGLFYGPGTGREDDWFARATEGTLKIPGEGTDFASLIHVADMADATAVAVERAASRSTFLVGDDHPSSWRDLLTYAAATVRAAAPPLGGPVTLPSFRASTRRLRETLDWAPRYPNVQAGLAR
jgi:nucleoside-diphosphate-sugar epimerase